MVAALLLLIGLGAISHYSTRMQAQTEGWVTHTHVVIESLYRVLGGVSAAESCLRGFGLTHDERLLRCFDVGLAEARSAQRATRELTRDNAPQQRRVAALEVQLKRRYELMTATRDRARDPAHVFTVPTEAIELSEAIHVAVFEMIEIERGLLAQRKVEADRSRQLAIASLWAVLGGALLFGGVAFSLLASEVRRRTRAEHEMSARHAEQAVLLNLAELLQACRSLEEAYDVIARLAPTLFSGHTGALHLFRSSRDMLERQAVWGAEPHGSGLFTADECWALRRGAAHSASNEGPVLYCKHVAPPHTGATLCLPLMGHGDVIGLLSLRSSSAMGEDARRLATLAAEQISMALANMQLRETLRNQSIRDPLTGLFNRRYAEETLLRELHRASREKTAVGVLMLDVDHFKRFNDTFGHEAGDYVLKEIAACLQLHTRKGDVISRMGGEELLVLLASSDIEQSLLKAEALRTAIAALALSHRGSELGAITISIGVAVSPNHGQAPDEVVRAADRALYQAKQGGRNRAVLASAELR